MTFRKSRMLDKVGPSAISRMVFATAEMKAQGRRIVGLHIGEPDFDTPAHVTEAAIAAMRAGDTHYTVLDGTPAAKEAVREKFARDNGLDFRPDEIMITSGAKMLLFAGLLATLDPGDEVITPAPYWVSYSDIVEMTGACAVVLPTTAADGFRLQAEALEAAITPRTRWLMLNSPSNPSGAVYGPEHYGPLLDVLERHPNVWLMVDDIYERIIFDAATFVTPAQLRPSLRDRILTINGVSKAYAMTGWRIGYAGGPAPLMQAMRAIISQSTSNPTSISQAATVAALTGPQDIVEQYRLEYQARRDLMMAELAGIPGLTCVAPQGTFYNFVGWQHFTGARTPDGRVLQDDEQFCDYLLRDHGLAVIPGIVFGSPGHIRLSFASARPVLREAMAILRAACAALS